MHSNKRGEQRLRYGLPNRYKKPPVEGQFDDVYSDHPNSEEPSVLKHLDSDSPNEESKHSEDSDYEDILDGGIYDEIVINKIISELT